MKAYAVEDQDSGAGEIVFARNPMEARRLHSEASGKEQTWLRARRAPEFDGLTGGIEELRRAQLERGWWFSCGFCDAHVELEIAGDEPVVVRDEHVYCNAWHAGAAAVRDVERRIREWVATERTLERFPGAVIESCWCTTRQGLSRPLGPEAPMLARATFRLPPLFYGVFAWWEDGGVGPEETNGPEFRIYKSKQTIREVAIEWLWDQAARPVPCGGLTARAVAATAAELRLALMFEMAPSASAREWLVVVEQQFFPNSLCALRACDEIIERLERCAKYS